MNNFAANTFSPPIGSPGRFRAYWKMLVFIPVLFYPPFVFVSITPTSIRVISFSIMVTYIFLKSSRIKTGDVFRACLILFTCILAINADMNSVDNIITALSTSLTLVFALILSRAVRDNIGFRAEFIFGYVVLFFVISSSVILGFIWHLLFSSEFNLFSIPTIWDLGGGYPYTINFFGLLLPKTVILGYDIYRSFSYFIEPVYLAPFLVANYFLVSKLLPTPLKNRFKWLNGIAGILTFSYLFPIAIAYFLITNLKMNIKAFIVFLIIFAATIATVYFDLYADSSLSERLHRMTIFLHIADNSDAAQILFGHGYVFTDSSFDRGIAAGFLDKAVQIGVVGSVAWYLFVLSIVGWRCKLFLFYILISFTVDPGILPLFFVLLLVLKIASEASVESKIPSIKINGLTQRRLTANFHP